MTDNPPAIGEFLTGTEYRDAIHIAVMPVVAAENLSSGDHIGLIKGLESHQAVKDENTIGIVDPFLLEPVVEGDHFYMFLYPNTITSLRHEWTHPAFEDNPVTFTVSAEKVLAADQWLHNFAALQAEINFTELMAGAKNYLDHDEWMIDGGKWEGVSVPDEFWDHFEVMTGRKVPNKDRGSFFSCSC